MGNHKKECTKMATNMTQSSEAAGNKQKFKIVFLGN